MSLKTITLIALAAIFGGVVASLATQPHNSHGGHGTELLSGDRPLETGQSAFAAIAEIVHILRVNPATDWANVDIDALRNHLVDMNNLTLTANVEEIVDDNGVTFVVTGEDATIDAIKAMVPAHARELEKMAGWSASTSVQSDGVKLVLKPASDNEKAIVMGLGFFGLMATGSHHQPHHFGMATGGMVHH